MRARAILAAFLALSCVSLLPAAGKLELFVGNSPELAMPFGIDFLADGTLRLLLRGTPGRRYRLERGGVLGVWNSVQEFGLVDASTVLADPGSAGSASRFYRVIDITP